MTIEEIKKAIDNLDYAKHAVRTCLNSGNTLVDMHDLQYWAKRVQELRTKIISEL